MSQEENSPQSMGIRVVFGAFVGWVSAFLLIIILFGRPDGDSLPLVLFLSAAPGVIIGIVIAYITANKNNNRYSTENTNSQSIGSSTKKENISPNSINELKELKSLYDNGTITEDEFIEIKRKILNKYL